MRVKDWKKFQHFKDRRPPWIKLYRDILDDPDWHALDADSAKVLVMLWLIASEDELQQGNLPDIRKLAFRMRMTEKAVEKACIGLSHWLYQDDIKPISDSHQDDAPETERETERETETKQRSRGSRLPQGWTPNPDLMTWASGERPDLDLTVTLERFRDHWTAAPGTKGVKADWEATWRNWVRNERHVKGMASARPTADA